MTLKRVELFRIKEFFSFLLISLFILSYSLLINFQNYKNLTRFDTAIVEATVLKQYTKIKQTKTYQILKLKTSKGVTFYTNVKKSFKNMVGKKLKLEIWTSKITFYRYLKGFYAYSKIQHIYEKESLKQMLNLSISSQHKDTNISNIYKALYTATPLNKDLQSSFSNIGVSHLLAISGFHLGILSALAFLLLRFPYKYLQNRYFPYRNSKTDLFIIVIFLLLSYMIFLDSPPSLLRAFTMLVVGFILYDRGIKIISMQTLLISIILLLSFFPKLLFTLGFWLSVSGVYYIFLFLIHFKQLNKILQFILMPFWVYLLMLPISLSIFGNFSIYHPLSIIWTALFTIFYPLSILLHLLNYGYLLDNFLEYFISLAQDKHIVNLDIKWLVIHIVLSLLSIYKNIFIWFLLCFSGSIFIYAIYNIT